MRRKSCVSTGQLFDANMTVDFVNANSDLSEYSLVIMPASYLLSDDAAQRFENYVSGGGRLVVSYLSGIVDQDNTIRLGGYPGACGTFWAHGARRCIHSPVKASK
jgi:beta-galactosidase GanA